MTRTMAVSLGRIGRERTTRDVPPMLRCFGYWSRKRQHWVGYCLELRVQASASTWEDLLEKLTLAASLHLAHLQSNPELRRRRLAPFRMRLLYAAVAMLHFVRPRGRFGIADLSRELLIERD